MTAFKATMLVSAQWDHRFRDCAARSKSTIRIVSPFIKSSALKQLLKNAGIKPQIITRFNLADCASQVNDLDAMRFALKRGGVVRGIKGLHTKLYIFDEREVLITSANLTLQGQRKNHELGVHAVDSTLVQDCVAYFNYLWEGSKSCEATEEKITDWEREIKDAWNVGLRPKHGSQLKDHGATVAGITEQGTAPLLSDVPEMPSAASIFVKFTGTSDDRCNEDTSVIAELARSGSHWVACFPAKKRPNQIKDGDLVFISRMVRENNDHRIYGYGTAIHHDPSKHNASPQDIALRSWMKIWSRQIRLQNTHFLSSNLAEGISLSVLMEKWGSNSFESTRKNKELGKGNITPKKALPQKAQVELTQDASRWLWQEVQQQMVLHGELAQDSLEKLDWPDKPMDQQLARATLPGRARALLRVIVEHIKGPEFMISDPLTYLGYKEALVKLSILSKSHFGRVLQKQGLSELYQWAQVFGFPAITGIIVNKTGVQAGFPSKGFFHSYGRSADDITWWKEQVALADVFDWSPYI